MCIPIILTNRSTYPLVYSACTVNVVVSQYHWNIICDKAGIKAIDQQFSIGIHTAPEDPYKNFWGGWGVHARK